MTEAGIGCSPLRLGRQASEADGGVAGRWSQRGRGGGGGGVQHGGKAQEQRWAEEARAAWSGRPGKVPEFQNSRLLQPQPDEGRQEHARSLLAAA